MDDTITLDEHGFRSVLAARPVTRESYRRYLHDTGQPLPRVLTQPAPPTDPITYVSQVDATTYCRWLSARQARDCRLPTMTELEELNSELAEHDQGPEAWPHTQGHLPEVIGGLKPVFLCEWTAETETVDQPAGRPARVLGSIFYPPWLREGSTGLHAQAHLLATEGYSFVTFRIAYDT
jgi:formylglycine-generating enzyme required for sulfatase activity